jgi:hypothetical protein
MTPLGQNVSSQSSTARPYYPARFGPGERGQPRSPPIELARDKFRETLPVTTGKLLEGHNQCDRVRVGCYEADERFRIELGKEGQA